MAPVSRAKAKAELAEHGPKTRSKRKESHSSPKNMDKKKQLERRISIDSLVGSSDEQKKIRRKPKKKKLNDNEDEDITDDECSDDSDEDHQYIIYGENLKKKYKVRYYDEFGIEDEIKEMKDPTFKKDNYKVVRAEYVKAKPRCRNVNECIVCDEMGEELISCARCPASFHVSCIESAMPSKKRPYEPWYCKRCKYEQNVLKKPKRVAKILPFDEEERYISTVEETLKKIPEEEMTLSKAFNIIAGLANPKGFIMPKDVLDHLVDMPYMEHIPRKTACSKNSFCYSCKQHPSQNSPAIECDYCPAKFHLHCLESPMTEVFNEFWMCPLHGEIGIDRFVLNTTGISKRMHYWNKCRAKVNPHKTWKEFIRKVKKEPFKKTVQKTFGGDVPTVIDWKYVKHHKLEFKDAESSTPESESSDEDITETKFMELTPTESSNFETAEDCNDQATVSSKPFYEYLNPKRYVAKNGFYPPELMNAKGSYFGSDGVERDSTNLKHVPVDELYYPEDDNQTTLAEEAAREIMQKFPFLLKFKNSVEVTDVEMPETSVTHVENETQSTAEINFEKSKIVESVEPIREQLLEELMEVEETPTMELLNIAELFNGQFCFPIKIYRKTKYFVEYYTDGDQIIGLFKKLLPPLNLQLDEYNTVAITAPESFTRVLSLESEEKSEETASQNGMIIQNSSGIESEYDSDAACDFYSTGTMTEKIRKSKEKRKKKNKKRIKESKERSAEIPKLEEENSEPKKANAEDLVKKVDKIKMKQMKIVPKEKLTPDISVIEKSIKKSVSVEKVQKSEQQNGSESDNEVVIIETPAYRRALRKAKQEAAKARKEEEEKIIAEAAKRGETINFTVTPTPALRRGGRRKRGRSRKESMVRKTVEPLNHEMFEDVTSQKPELQMNEVDTEYSNSEKNPKTPESDAEMFDDESKMPVLVPQNAPEEVRETMASSFQKQKRKLKKHKVKSTNILKKKIEKIKKKKRKRSKDKISATSEPRLVQVIRKRSKSVGKIVKRSAKITKSNTRSKFFRSLSLPPPLIGPVQSYQEKKLKASPKPSIEMSQPLLLEESENLNFDFTKLMKLECRKVGHFLYLMTPQIDDSFLIISRMTNNDQVLAYFSNYQEQQKLISASFKYQMNGEERVINYQNVISAVVEYEKLQKRCYEFWNQNFGIFKATEMELKKNIDDVNFGEYILDKRFIIPSLPIIGSLFIISPHHSFATIPIYYPICNIGNTADDTINLSILAPNCNLIRKKHCSIVYDKSNCCVYVKPLGYTVIDNYLYGGVSTTAPIENTCPCVKDYHNAKFIGNRIMRKNVKNDTVIQIGCLKFKVMIIPIEQIWEQIPDSNLRICDTRLPITIKPSMNVAPDPFDDELSGSSVSYTDSECEQDANKDMTNSYVIL